MYISKLKLNNFKGFLEKHEFSFSEGVNFLVGNNNCGKTTIFRAIEFLQKGGSKDNFINNKIGKEECVSVEVEITGERDLELFIENSVYQSVKKLKPYVIDNHNGTFSVRILRSLREGIDSVEIYNPNDCKYENIEDGDEAIKNFFRSQFVYSDLNNDEYQNFSEDGFIRELIKGYTNSIKRSKEWKDFERSYKDFISNGIKKQLKCEEKEISSFLQAQYGYGNLKVDFKSLDMNFLLEAGSLELEEHGITTKVSDKGAGMQRALTLSLIRYISIVSNVYAKKQLFFFIDEPETFLHPMAQEKLLDTFEEIAERSQVFITTHSPYLLRNFKKDAHKLMIFEKDENGNNKLQNDNQTLSLFGESSPTWGEINYFAFDVLSVEFHNELYGFLQAKAMDEDEDNYFEKDFDQWLVGKCFAADKNYIGLKKDGTTYEDNRTLPTYIRNLIHHPENKCNEPYTEEELKISTEKMIKLLQQLP